ncbi:MAG: phosphopyruvate hydratase [Candidatus Nealsonbacteria bacterium]
MKSSKIRKVKAREILDSRGNPTIEVELETNDGVFVSSAPSGASAGKYETVELRDKEKRYFGKGVLRAVDNINNIIAPKVIGKDPGSQKQIDALMIKLDGTENKSYLGANAIYPVSLAVCRAGAGSKKLELFQYINKIAKRVYGLKIEKPDLPNPLFNVINGGVHSGSQLDIQEFMLVIDDESFSKILQIGSEIYHQLKNLLLKKYGKIATNVGDEGGFAPPFVDSEQALEFIFKAAKDLGYESKVKVILDVASSQFFDNGKYKINIGVFTTDGLLRYYSNLLSKYPILGLEDPFSEDDWQGFKSINKKFGKKILIIGDDLLVTNSERIKKAKAKKAVNAMILKINQIGTVSETLQAAKLAKQFGWKTIVSHRSGETDDNFIADFSVGIGADFIKTGAPARGERIVKYNRLLRIEEELK